jgi:hypothetical protein
VRRLLAIAVGALALALAGPATAEPGYTALYPETVPGAGLVGFAGATHTIVRLAHGGGMVGSVPFSLVKTRVVYGRFRSTRIRTTLWGLNAVKLRGTGVVNGRTVAFTAVGVHNALPGVDVFRIAWNHGASVGGRVTTGSVFIR